MSIAAGRLDQKVLFRRRVAISGPVGSLRGGFRDLGQCWCSFRENAPQEATVGILRTGLITTRDNAFIRSITQSDRAVVEGIEFEITSIARPVQQNGDVRMTLTQAPSGSSFDRELEQRGEVVTVRRIVPNDDPIEVDVRARVTGYDPEELVGGIDIGDRKVLLSAQDLENSVFPLPLKPNSTDRLIVRGKSLMIAAIDDNTHRFAGELVAYQIRATG